MNDIQTKQLATLTQMIVHGVELNEDQRVVHRYLMALRGKVNIHNIYMFLSPIYKFLSHTIKFFKSNFSIALSALKSLYISQLIPPTRLLLSVK